MKAIPAALQAHLDGGATTLCYCWRVTRHDGVVLGFTEHDRDVVYAGTTFAALTGFTASQIQQGLGLSVGNLAASGAITSTSITDADLLAGRYDDATVELFWVNWADTSQGVTIAVGNLGEVKRQGIAFQAEFRSLANRINQRVGQTYERLCSAVLGDGRCKVDLSQPAFKGTFTVLTGDAGRIMTVAGLAGFASDWFTAGTLAFGAGADATLAFEVKSHRRTSGSDVIELWLPPPFPIASGDTGTILAGCRKTLAVCRSKFDNVANHRGFPHIPGTDVVTRYGVQGALGQSGGSLFGSG